MNITMMQAHGIANSIAMVFVLFSMGLNQGMQPIAGYNYGSQQFDRLMSVVKLAIISATVMMTSGWLVAMFAPYYCARMFTTDPELIRQAIDAIQVMMLMFPIIGGQMVITNFFQCIGKVKISIFLSLSRQLLFLLPLLAVLPHFYNIKGVWASLPMSDLAAAIVAAAIMVAYMKKMKKQMNS